jgi:L-aminopeptidase/D-esterase-like protein
MLRITSIPNIKVGHATHDQENTGCTVVLCGKGAVAGVDIRGSAPGTRETELLRPGFMIRQIHGIMMTGGSAFGLRTADGAMQYLSEQGIGYDARGVCVPIVPAAVIFDLRGERNSDFPNREMGYEACRNATIDFEEGLTGAGKGATVGKILGIENCMKGGVGSSAIQIRGGVKVGAIAVVNALGDVVDPANGKITAGARKPNGRGFVDTVKYLVENPFPKKTPDSNTTLAVVATNANFTKEEINKIAQMAQNGISRTIRPVHTMHDGDIVFSLSTGKLKSDVSVVGEIAAQMVSQAILRAVRISNKLLRNLTRNIR